MLQNPLKAPWNLTSEIKKLSRTCDFIPYRVVAKTTPSLELQQISSQNLKSIFLN